MLRTPLIAVASRYLQLPSLLILAGIAVGCGSAARAESAPRPAAAGLSVEDHRLLEDLQRAAFQFFVEQRHPQTGLVRDRARADGSPSEGKASIAASGFAYSAWVIAVERGWVTREQALAALRSGTRFLVEQAPRRHGFFYHFMEMESGARAWRCEVSSIDSALLFAGAMVAREYFADAELTALVNRMLGEVDWEWFRGGGKLVSLGWHDETGFSRYRWDHFSEHLLMSFLALGVSERPLEATYWYEWSRRPVGRHGSYVYLQEPPLFVYQFPQAYLDLRGFRDATVDHFRNSRLATLAQRDFSLGLRGEFPSWGEHLWGVTASDSVTGYKAWGGPPRTQEYNALDGTVVPCAAAGSLIFAPRETLAVLHHLRMAHGDRIWKRYGFVDAFNPETGWVNEDVIGIDLGISLVQAENLRTGLIQRLFMQAPEVRAGMKKAGMLAWRRELTAAQQDAIRAAASSALSQLRREPAGTGLQLTAWLAAQRLGLVTGREAQEQVKALIEAPGEGTSAWLAAGLITARQMLPSLADSATARLEALDWSELAGPTGALGGTERLGIFLQVARGIRPPAAWQALDRGTVAIPPVHVLAPVSDAGAVVPGLWLDEKELLSGASASQLAFAGLYHGTVTPVSALTAALWLEHFPAEALARLGPAISAGPLPGGPEAQAALLITAANLLTADSLRCDFQNDDLIRAGRSAIAEFSEAAFGPNTSIIAQRELAGPSLVPVRRTARARAGATPRGAWDWQVMAGLEFKDSVADVRPEDPALALRFAFTWDETALHLHAEVMDTPTGQVVPLERNRFVELFIDPQLDGLEWLGAQDFQFGIIKTHFWRQATPGVGVDFFHGATISAEVTASDDGYRIEASIPWRALGLTPRAGLELGVSPAVVAAGTKEWEPALKLNWSYHREGDGHARLGVLRLE